MQNIAQGILFVERVKTRGDSPAFRIRDWNRFFEAPPFEFKKEDRGCSVLKLFPCDGIWLEKQIEKHIHQTNFEWDLYISEAEQDYLVTGYRSGTIRFVLVFNPKIDNNRGQEEPKNGNQRLSVNHPSSSCWSVGTQEDPSRLVGKGFPDQFAGSDEVLTNALTKVSHGIRTPLNGVIGFAQYLKSRLQGEKDYEEYCDIIIDNGYRLLQTANNMISYFKLVTVQMKTQISECSLNEQLDEIIKEFSRNTRKLKSKQVELKRSYALDSGRDNMLLDCFNLWETLDKLLDNALKYTRKGEVKLSYEFKDSNTLLFHVKDSGPGIPRENIDLIFQKFRQSSDTMDSELGGVGLGLAIARELIARMGGEIFLETTEGRGSCFSFTLPYRPANRQAAFELGNQQPGSEKQ